MRPLEGVKVVELATFVAVPTCGRFLADQGAEVIRVEAPSGDPSRWGAASEWRSDSPYENTGFDLDNGNKKCIAVNLKDPKGREVLEKLIAQADIFLTNWRMAPLKKMGLDYDTLKKTYPALVFASVSGYGDQGPDKDLPGYDFTAFWSRSGALESIRQKDGWPVNVIPGFGDHVVGMALSAGVMAAFVKALRTGEGDKVTVSLFHTAIFCQGIMLQAAQEEEIGKQYPISHLELNNPFNAACQTKDGRFIQTCVPPYNLFYPKMMKLLELEEYLNEEKYSTVEALAKNDTYVEFAELIAGAYRKKTAEEWTKILTEGDIPFAIAQNWLEVLADPQAEGAEVFCHMQYPTGNTRKLVRQPIRIGDSFPEFNRGPYLGEQSEEILAALGYSEEECSNMHEAGTYVTWEDVKGKHKG